MNDDAMLAKLAGDKLHVGAPAARTGYDPSLSRLKEETLVAFLRAPIHLDLKSVPGVGKVGKRQLINHGVTNTFNLIGKFLSLRADEDTPQEHCDKFWRWIDTAGISVAHRDMVVQAIAEKVDTMIPGFSGKEMLKIVE